MRLFIPMLDAPVVEIDTVGYYIVLQTRVYSRNGICLPALRADSGTYAIGVLDCMVK